MHVPRWLHPGQPSTRRGVLIPAALVLVALVVGVGALTLVTKEPDTRNVATPGARSYAKSLLHHPSSRHGNLTNWGCLNALWQRESGWNHRADNPSSSAYGIPQALPGSKMGPGWRTDWRVQVAWGVRYVWARYINPCRAWAHSESRGWY